MKDVTNDATNDDAARRFAARLREAVEEKQRSTGWRARGRHKLRRVVTPISAPLANPTRVRYSDELFVDRVRRQLD